MPVKKRVSKQRPYTISDEVLRLFALCEEIRAKGLDEEWEDVGGRRRELLDAEKALFRELRLKPWDASPLRDDLDGEPAYGGDWLLINQTRPAALEIRREILAAMGRRS